MSSSKGLWPPCRIAPRRLPLVNQYFIPCFFAIRSKIRRILVSTNWAFRSGVEPNWRISGQSMSPFGVFWHFPNFVYATGRRESNSCKRTPRLGSEVIKSDPKTHVPINIINEINAGRLHLRCVGPLLIHRHKFSMVLNSETCWSPCELWRQKNIHVALGEVTCQLKVNFGTNDFFTHKNFRKRYQTLQMPSTSFGGREYFVRLENPSSYFATFYTTKRLWKYTTITGRKRNEDG